MTAEKKTLSRFLAAHKWRLIQIDKSQPLDIPVVLSFDFRKKKLHGSLGDRFFECHFDMIDETIQFSKIQTQGTTGSKDLLKQGNRLLEIVSYEGLTFDVADQTLNVYQGEKLLLMFGKMPQDEGNLHF